MIADDAPAAEADDGRDEVRRGHAPGAGASCGGAGVGAAGTGTGTGRGASSGSLTIVFDGPVNVIVGPGAHRNAGRPLKRGCVRADSLLRYCMTASRASRLVLGSGGVSSSDLVGDTLRWILPAAGVVLSLWVIAVPPPLPRIAGVLATLAVAAALGYRLRPGHAGHSLLPAIWIVASAVVVWWAGTPPGLPLLFVLWSGAAAIGLTGRAGALAHMLLAAVALGAALALAPGPTPAEGRVQIWAITMAGLVSVGLLLRGLATTLRDVDERFGRAFEDASIGMAVADLDMRVIEPNPAFCALLGRTPEEIIGRRVRQFTHPDDRDLNVSLHNELASGRSSSYRLVKRYLRPDGGVVWAQITVSLVRDRRRRPRYVYAQIEDITERRRAEAERERNSRALARRARLGEAAAELGRVALVVPGMTELADHMAHTVAECLGVDVCCVCQLDGDTLLTLGGVGLPDGRAAGRRFPLRERSFPALALATDGVLQVADVQADPRVDLSDTMRGRGVRGGLAVAVRDRGGDAGMIFAHDLGAREFDADEVAFVRVAGNVLGSAIERAKREADALHRAHHDPLTGLPNRDLFADRLGQALARARRGEAPPAVLLRTSTSSSSSTTRWGTRPGTSCCARSPRASPPPCGRTTRWRASAATSS